MLVLFCDRPQKLTEWMNVEIPYIIQIDGFQKTASWKILSELFKFWLKLGFTRVKKGNMVEELAEIIAGNEEAIR